LDLARGLDMALSCVRAVRAETGGYTCDIRTQCKLSFICKHGAYVNAIDMINV